MRRLQDSTTLRQSRRRAVVAVPLALLSSACVSEPWQTPQSARNSSWLGESERATLIPTVLPSMATANAEWVLPPSSPWAAYEKVTLLSSLDSAERVVELPAVHAYPSVMRAELAASVVASVGLPDDTLWVVDLRGAASVAFGARLSALSDEGVAPVLTFNNWPADDELVPAEETLAALVTYQPRLDPSITAHPVFLLDAWRLAFRDSEPDEEITDNRYMLSPADLPDASVLLERGLTRVLYVVESTTMTAAEEDDLHRTFLDYQQAGIAISIVDLDWLMTLDAPARWHERLVGRPLVIDPLRVTLIGDPSFYIRAHGGFGGIRGVPAGGGGHGYFGGGHGGG